MNLLDKVYFKECRKIVVVANGRVESGYCQQSPCLRNPQKIWHYKTDLLQV